MAAWQSSTEGTPESVARRRRFARIQFAYLCVAPGFCVGCGAPTGPEARPFAKCEVCKRLHNADMRALRRRRVATGCCSDCGRKAEPSLKRCRPCLNGRAIQKQIARAKARRGAAS